MSRRTNPLKPDSIFVSHTAQEATVAAAFKRVIERHFVHLDVFVSSVPSDNLPGDNWLTKVSSELMSCKAVIIICSKESMLRPWINFEAGAGWIREVPVIPLCHSGLSVSALPLPFSVLQSVDASDEDELQKVVQKLSKVLGTRMPSVDFREFSEALKAYTDQNMMNRGSLMVLPHSRDAQLKIGERIVSATKEIWISGVQFAVSLSDWRAEYLDALSRGVDIKCAFLDPDSKDVAETAKYFSMSVDELRLECLDCLNKCRNIAQEREKLVEHHGSVVGSFSASTYNALPRARYYVIDPNTELESVIYVPYVEGIRSSSCPAYIYPSGHEIGKTYINVCKGIISTSVPV